MRFDLTDLRLFCEVTDAGSITGGAERCALALAAASTRIRNLEGALGAPLLERSRQGVTPTPAGRALLKHARTILSQTARLREDLGAFAGGQSGEVRLLANTNALTEFLPEALSRFLAEHPHVSINLEERLSDEIVGLVAEGAGDVGIVAGTVDMGSLATFPFRSDRFVVVAAAGALNQRRAMTFADVLDYDLVGLDRASSLQRFLSAKAVREGKPLRLRVQLRSFDAVCRLVECGVGVGIVPETTARRAARTMDLALVELTDDWARRDLALCVRSLESLAPYARELVDSLRAVPPQTSANQSADRISSSRETVRSNSKAPSPSG